MTFQEIIGYSAALFIGLALGLTGAGGSILTVPILVYILKVEPVLSTAYSLFVVGSTASIGAVSRFRKNQVHLKTAVAFGLPSIISIFLTRKFILDAIPEVLFFIGKTPFTKGAGILILFAVLMVLSAVRMIRSGNNDRVKPNTGKGYTNYLLLVSQGLFVGILTGLVGAGGGFLIVPALVILAHLPMKMAIGTSLVIIASNSLIGFLGDISERVINWGLLLPFALIAVIGIFVGMALSRNVDGPKLKKGFGYFIFIVAAWIIFAELSIF